MSWTLENYDRLAVALGEHVMMVGIALVLSLAIAFPIGIWTARRPTLYVVAMAVTGILYTIPALALFALMIPFLGLGTKPAVVALVLYSLLILVRNIAIGIREVPAELIEAADGMGYGAGRRLLRIELPLAMPVIVAGIRITVVTQILGGHHRGLYQRGRAGRHHLPGHHPGLWREDRGRRRRHLAAGDRGRRDAAPRRAPSARLDGGARVMLRDMLGWFASNPGAFEQAATQHLLLSATALAAAIAIALPLALALTRWTRAANPTIAAVNVLRTIPSLALLVVALPLLGTGFLPAVIALTLYGLPAILINTHTALTHVDADIVEAGQGQGMTDAQVMRRIMIPLALPVVFAGIRTGAVQIVSAATLAAFIGGGGLGELITAGMGTMNMAELMLGGLAVALLAVATELTFACIEWSVR